MDTSASNNEEGLSDHTAPLTKQWPPRAHHRRIAMTGVGGDPPPYARRASADENSRPRYFYRSATTAPRASDPAQLSSSTPADGTNATAAAGQRTTRLTGVTKAADGSDGRSVCLTRVATKLRPPLGPQPTTRLTWIAAAPGTRRAERAISTSFCPFDLH